MEIKRVLRIILFFLIFYLLLGIISLAVESYLLFRIGTGYGLWIWWPGFENLIGWLFEIIISIAWGRGLIGLFFGFLVALILIAFLIWLSYFIDKKLFPKK